MNNLLRSLLPDSAFARSVGVLAGGTGAAQLLLILAAPILTRLYTPDDFGLLAVYVALIGLFSVVTSFRYEQAIPLPSSDQDAAHVAALCCLLVVCVTLFASATVMIAGTSIANVLNVPRLAGYFWLLPVSVLMVGIYQVLNQWGVRTRQFTLIARTRVWQAISMLAIQLLAFKAGGFALLAGQAGAHSVGSVALARAALLRPELGGVRWRGILSAAKRYRRFPIFSTWSGLLNSTGQHIPPLMFAALFSVNVAGLYALASRVLAVPMSVIGQSVANVFFAHAAERHREGTLGTLLTRVQDILFRIAMPPAVLMVLLGPDLFRIVFGDEWTESGNIARLLTPWLVLVFVSSPVSQVLFVLQMQRADLAFQAILAATRIAAIIIGAWTASFSTTIALFGLVSSICWLGFLLWITWLVTRKLNTTARTLARLIPTSLLVASPVLVAKLGQWGAHWTILATCVSILLTVPHYRQVIRDIYQK